MSNVEGHTNWSDSKQYQDNLEYTQPELNKKKVRRRNIRRGGWRPTLGRNSVTMTSGRCVVTAPRNCTIFGCDKFANKASSSINSFLFAITFTTVRKAHFSCRERFYGMIQDVQGMTKQAFPRRACISIMYSSARLNFVTTILFSRNWHQNSRNLRIFWQRTFDGLRCNKCPSPIHSPDFSKCTLNEMNGQKIVRTHTIKVSHIDLEISSCKN